MLETSGRETSAQALAALGDPARLAIVRVLRDGTTCACEIAPRLAMAPNLLSYHLRILREAGLVERERAGRRVNYRLRPQTLQELGIELVRLAIGGGHDVDRGDIATA